MLHKKDIPNILSVIRIIMVPVFVYLFLSNRIVPSVMVFVLAGLTDVVDGYIARRFKYFSKLGLLLDPLADKLLQASAFVCLYIVKLIPVWMLVIYVTKELILGVGTLFLFKRRNNIQKSNVFGKFSSLMIFVAIIVLIIFGESIGELGIDLICVVVILSIITALVMYILQAVNKNFKKINR